MADKQTRAAELLTQMTGQDAAQRSARPHDGFAPDLTKIIIEHAFENLWARPGLSPRDRSLLTLGILMSQRAEHELHFHIPAALRNGLTQDEVAEIIYHVSGYAGFPAAVTARNVAGAILKDWKG